MNRRHLLAFVWLRWRLLANQWRRAGALNAVLMTIVSVAALVAVVPLFIGGFALEARAHAGLVLAGQIATDDGTRKLNPSLGWGGRLTLNSRYGALDAGLQRVDRMLQ